MNTFFSVGYHRDRARVAAEDSHALDIEVKYCLVCGRKINIKVPTP